MAKTKGRAPKGRAPKGRAPKVTEEVSIVNVSTENQYIPDPSDLTGQAFIRDLSSAGRSDTEFKKLGNAIKSAVGSLDGFVEGIKKVDQSTGIASQQFAVSKKAGKQLNASIAYQDTKQNQGTTNTYVEYLDPDDRSKGVVTTEGVLIKGTKEFKGKQAQALAKGALQGVLGGDINFSKERGKEEFADYSFITNKEKYDRYVAEHILYQNLGADGAKRLDISPDARMSAENRLVKDYFGEADKASKNEQKNRDKIEEEKNKETQEKAKEERTRSIRTHLLKGLTILTAIANIARRILTAVLSSAVQSRKDAIEAQTVGISSYTKREYDNFDISHTLEKGTTFKAVQSMQDKFGDVTKLDEKSLEVLARVMGTDINKMVQSGMGGDDPKKLMENILDKYFASYKSGKNSLGQYVGRDKALMELNNSLKSIAPELSTLFSAMVLDWNTQGRKEGFNAGGWFSQNATGSYGWTKADENHLVALGASVSVLKGSLDDLAKTVQGGLMQALSGFIDKLNNSKLGKTDTKKTEMLYTDMEKLTAEETYTRQAMDISKKRMATVLAEIQKGGEFKDLTVDDLIRHATRENYDKAIENKSYAYNENAKKIYESDIKKYPMVRKLLAYESFSANSDLLSSLATYTISEQRHSRAEGDIKQGSKAKFDDNYYSVTEQAEKAEELLKTWRKDDNTGFNLKKVLKQQGGFETLPVIVQSALLSSAESYISQEGLSLFRQGSDGTYKYNENKDYTSSAFVKDYKTRLSALDIDLSKGRSMSKEDLVKLESIYTKGKQAELKQRRGEKLSESELSDISLARAVKEEGAKSLLNLGSRAFQGSLYSALVGTLRDNSLKSTGQETTMLLSGVREGGFSLDNIQIPAGTVTVLANSSVNEQGTINLNVRLLDKDNRDMIDPVSTSLPSNIKGEKGVTTTFDMTQRYINAR